MSICFAYIHLRQFLSGDAVPAAVAGLPKRPFAVLGSLDCVTCLLLTFAAVYLPGPLLILLPQAAIPVSMALSARLKGERYARSQYVGAAVVVAGILVVLEPLVTGRHAPGFVCEAYDPDFCAACGEETTEAGCLSHGDGGPRGVVQVLAASDASATACRWVPFDDARASVGGASAATTLLWSVLTILACVPMALSSIFKEQALGGPERINPMFLNGWVALFQVIHDGTETKSPVQSPLSPSVVTVGVRALSKREQLKRDIR